MMKHSRVYTAIGLLLLAAALFLADYNIWSDTRAGKSASTVLAQLNQEIEENGEKEVIKGEADASALEAADDETQEEAYIPDYILNPEKRMPSVEIDREYYIGVLKIPAISLELPIVSQWSYSGLKIAPCRYSGSAYLGNMVIAGHNYYSHFAYLKRLSPGDEVTFTDVDGNVFDYRVSEIEILSPYAVTEMTSGDWDLTLFTCTVGGQSRVTVRCERMNKASYMTVAAPGRLCQDLTMIKRRIAMASIIS